MGFDLLQLQPLLRGVALLQVIETRGVVASDVPTNNHELLQDPYYDAVLWAFCVPWVRYQGTGVLLGAWRPWVMDAVDWVSAISKSQTFFPKYVPCAKGEDQRTNRE